jgi:hypothetical protein
MLSSKRRAAMPEPDPHAPSKPSDDHELTPMEGFFDNLFNHHMVLPQTPETRRSRAWKGMTRCATVTATKPIDVEGFNAATLSPSYLIQTSVASVRAAVLGCVKARFALRP